MPGNRIMLLPVRSDAEQWTGTGIKRFYMKKFAWILICAMMAIAESSFS